MSGRRLAGILAIILMCIAPGRQVSAAVDPNASFQVESNNWAQWPQAADVQAKTGVVMEAETGRFSTQREWTRRDTRPALPKL